MSVKKPRKIHWMRVSEIGKDRGKTSCGQTITVKKHSYPEKWINHDGAVMELAVWPLGGSDVTCDGCRQALDREAAEAAEQHRGLTYCPI